MKNKYLILTLTLIIGLFGCSRPKRPNLKAHLEKRPHRQVQSYYALSNGQFVSRGDDDIWFYIWLNNQNQIISVERSTYTPAQMGYIYIERPPVEMVAKTNGPQEGEEVEQEGQIEAGDNSLDAQIDAENSQIDSENASAIESFENEGGSLSNDSAESSGIDSGSSGGSDPGSSGGDPGGSSSCN